MELGEAILMRRSVRDYTGRVPDEATVRRLIDAAVNAPSANNRQPWRFTVVRDRALLDRLDDEARAFLLESLAPGPDADERRAELLDPEDNFLYNAPMLIVVSAVAAGKWNAADCALAAQNLMLAAHAEGLGSCWIGMVQDYLGTPAGKALLGLPDAWVPSASIIVGYPAVMPRAVPRDEPEIRWVG
jgi:nitroreductase